jgi:hypothetical protein
MGLLEERPALLLAQDRLLRHTLSETGFMIARNKGTVG